MPSILALSTTLFTVASATWLPSQLKSQLDTSYGFSSPQWSTTTGGHGTCVQGNIAVEATAQLTQLNFASPANQSVVTETIVEFLQIDSPLPAQVTGAQHSVSGTYNINAKLCYPVGQSPNASLVQILTHGVGFDKSYWDFYSSQYSYQDAAAAAGYTTFSYDRLGIGLSDHPDPIQVVQAPLEIEIAHQLTQMLRAGSIAKTSFTHVVGVGHSLGSIISNGVTAQYPKDFDAVVLTGFSVDAAGQPVFFGALDLVIARENSPWRFPLLPNGYIIVQSQAGNQFDFFRLPNFDQNVLVAATNAKQTVTFGEIFTLSSAVKPAPDFTGPIDVVTGEFDLPFCQSNCLVPSNKLAAVQPTLYPNAKASSTYYVGKGAGHGLNLHYVAPQAYQQIFSFISSNGF